MEGIQYIGGITSVHAGDNISTCGGITSVQWGITSVLWRVFSTVGKNFNFGMFRSRKDIDVFCITIRNFHSEVFRKFKQISCMLRAGLVYSRSNLVSK